MLKKDTPNGVIVYEGPSLIDGSPIVVIANSLIVSRNRKIGDMIQVWILRADMHPHDALKTGNDFAICGNCFHRGVFENGKIKNRTCYVSLMKQGVFSIYKAYKRGSYPVISDNFNVLFQGRHIRFGSYGDPASVPFEVWDKLSKLCQGGTGYTHLWMTCDQRLSSLCMASCETIEQQALAQKMGWRTFRVIVEENDSLLKNEIRCLAQTKGVHCDSCGICDGTGRKKKNVAVVFHGQAGKKEQYLSKLSSL